MAVTNTQKPTALTALTLSALAIPSLVASNASQAAAVPEKQKVAVRYTQYQEADLSANRIQSGSTERYGIKVLQMSYFTPLQQKYSVQTNATFETLSGASPYGSYDYGSGQTLVTMSGASGGITEQRLDASVLGTRYFKEGTVGASAAISTENDYQSIALGLDGSLEIFDKHTTLLASMSVSFDELSPTDAELFSPGSGRADADGEKKRSFSFYEGVTQVIDKNRTLQVGVGYTRKTGHLSDPYRYDDNRPDAREQYTLSTQYRHYLSNFGDMAWHLDYRFYQDDWDVIANTVSTSVWKDISVGPLNFTIAPNFRYYWQHAAKFYTLEVNPAADPDVEYYSNDYRLSAYGAITMGLDTQFHYKDTVYTVSISQYLSAEGWGLTGSQSTETPALVNFTTLSFGLEHKF